MGKEVCVRPGCGGCRTHCLYIVGLGGAQVSFDLIF